jgi:hypothetical protein
VPSVPSNSTQKTSVVCTYISQFYTTALKVGYLLFRKIPFYFRKILFDLPMPLFVTLNLTQTVHLCKPFYTTALIHSRYFNRKKLWLRGSLAAHPPQ